MRNIAIVQKLIPHYRISFFSSLYSKEPGLILYHSTQVQDDGLVETVSFPFRNIWCENKKFGAFEWQSGLVAQLPTKYNYIVLGLELKYLSNFIVWFLCLFCNTKVIWWTHGYNVHLREKNFIFWVDRLIKTVLMKFSYKILLYTDYNLQEVVRMGIDEKKIIVLNNALDEKPYQYAFEQIKENDVLQLDDKTKQSNHTIAFIGRLTKGKKVNEVLTIAVKLLKKFPDLRVFIIGDGNEKDYLQQQARDMDLLGTVFFMGTITDPYDLGVIMQVTDFTILPGAVGLSLVHSMIYGVPFVTLENENHGPEIAYLKNDYNGYMARDIDDTCEWISDCYLDRAKMLQLKKNCLSTIKSEVNLEHMVDKFISAFG